MKKIATITFHSPYNYGSNLQAYALQEYIKKLCNGNCDYQIINLRTPIQKEMYTNFFMKKGIKNKLKSLIIFNKKHDIFLKEKRFEEFMKNYLNLTKEYNSLEELIEEQFDYDYYISGSDQLWNLRARDFDWAYYLEFVKTGKRVSYAASFGPLKQSWDEEQMRRVKDNLLKYDSISVREKGSFDNVKKLTALEPEINVDPTMLLDKNDWDKIIPKENKLNKDYILLYDLGNQDETRKIALKVSKILKMPVAITRYMGVKHHFSRFEKYYDCGTLEFLNLVKNAKLILSSSFHGTVFSIILNKPFYAINGLKDFRISTLLEKTNLEERTIQSDNIEQKCKDAFKIDFKAADTLLDKERKKSEQYLRKALDIE